jgi:hypothetical protein
VRKTGAKQELAGLYPMRSVNADDRGRRNPEVKTGMQLCRGRVRGSQLEERGGLAEGFPDGVTG